GHGQRAPVQFPGQVGGERFFLRQAGDEGCPARVHRFFLLPGYAARGGRGNRSPATPAPRGHATGCQRGLPMPLRGGGAVVRSGYSGFRASGRRALDRLPLRDSAGFAPDFPQSGGTIPPGPVLSDRRRTIAIYSVLVVLMLPYVVCGCQALGGGRMASSHCRTEEDRFPTSPLVRVRRRSIGTVHARLA